MPSDHKHRSYSDYVDLRDDGRIVLYKRNDHDNPRWNVRIKVPGQTGYVVKSCKTRVFDEAKRFSEDLYFEIEGKSRRGESVKSRPFKRVVDEWKDDLPYSMLDRTEYYVQQNIRRAELHLVPYFDRAAIDTITEDQIASYFSNRLSTSKKRPSTITLRHEGTVLNQIFRFAKRKGYVSTVPEVRLPRLVINARPDITRSEWQILYRFLRDHVRNSPDKRRYRERLYLQNYILILANTGIRIGEMREVRWSNISSARTVDGSKRVTVDVDGKTGFRTVICNPNVDRYFERLWKYRKDETGKDPQSSEFVFCHNNGKQILSFKKGFQRVLEECGILYGSDNKKRVPYSLRHTYATMRIAEGVSVYQLASNMGTSVEMIELYYGKKRTRDPKNVSEITKMSLSALTESDSTLPWE